MYVWVCELVLAPHQALNIGVRVYAGKGHVPWSYLIYLRGVMVRLRS